VTLPAFLFCEEDCVDSNDTKSSVLLGVLLNEKARSFCFCVVGCGENRSTIRIAYGRCVYGCAKRESAQPILNAGRN
jgi:hypothetical protein